MVTMEGGMEVMNNNKITTETTATAIRTVQSSCAVPGTGPRATRLLTLSPGSAPIGPPLVILQGKPGPQTPLHMVSSKAGLPQPPREALSWKGREDGHGNVRRRQSTPGSARSFRAFQSSAAWLTWAFPSALAASLSLAAGRAGQQPEHCLP